MIQCSLGSAAMCVVGTCWHSRMQTAMHGRLCSIVLRMCVRVHGLQKALAWGQDHNTHGISFQVKTSVLLSRTQTPCPQLEKGCACDFRRGCKRAIMPLQGAAGPGALPDRAGGARRQRAPGGRACVDGDAQLQEVPPADVHGAGRPPRQRPAPLKAPCQHSKMHLKSKML